MSEGDIGRRERGIPRERLAEMVEAGMTIERMAGELGRSTLTVRRWLARYGLQTLGALDPAARAGSARRLPSELRLCKLHGEMEFALSGDGYFRCRRCRSESLLRRRRRVRETLVAEAGGACVICGYDRYVGGLQFHHVDRSEKRLGLSMGGASLAIDTLRSEARKCVLLCGNCHAEVEAGIATVPLL